MFKKIVLGFALLIVAVLIYAATRPNSIHIEATMLMKAPPEKIFPYINDLTRFAEWSPYEKLDPEMKKTLSGPSSGIGAVSAWEGSKSGTGRMEIVVSVPPSTVGMKLDMMKPLRCSNMVNFTLKPEGELTSVTWLMTGQASFPQKLMGLIFSSEMVRQQFESGLTNLKALVEK